MKINGIEAYAAHSINTNENGVQRGKEINTEVEPSNSNGLSKNGNNDLYTLSSSEREFFMQMFPENSEQIKNYTLFNRNGKLQTPDINKGILFDGRA